MPAAKTRSIADALVNIAQLPLYVTITFTSLSHLYQSFLKPQQA